MTGIHPSVQEKLYGQLPEGAKIVETTVTSAEESAIKVILVGGNTESYTVIRRLIAEHLGNERVEILVDEGQTLNSVIAEFSNTYNLYWVSGIDYEESDRVVVFDKSGVATILLKIPETSLLWRGSVELKLLERDRFSVDSTIKEVNLETSRIALALTSKIFLGEGKVFTGDKKSLTAKFCKSVVAYLQSVNINSVTAADLGNGEIIDVVCDGFSGMIVLKPKNHCHVFIRYRSKGEDVRIESPGDADPV